MTLLTETSTYVSKNIYSALQEATRFLHIKSIRIFL